MLIFDIDGTTHIPIDAMEESSDVGEIFSLEDAFVFGGIKVIVLLVEFGIFISWHDDIFGVYIN